jgi:prepilin-type N-terminal cleavage/methylation domain-containing protein
MKAFSLLELSIVVAVIGLIISATTIGQQILEKAKLISTINQFSQLESAIINFKDRYIAYPGDFSDAYRYFDNGKNICGTKAECNGNGNGKIEVKDKYNSETYRAWQHLSLAKIIKGNYSGIWGKDNYVMQAHNQGNLTLKYEKNYGNIIKLGNFYKFDGQTSDTGLLYPERAEIIDLKMDDGLPNSGQIIAFNGIISSEENLYDTNCINGNNYQVKHNTTKPCTIGLILY